MLIKRDSGQRTRLGVTLVVAGAILGSALCVTVAMGSYPGGESLQGFNCDPEDGCNALLFDGSFRADHATAGSNGDGSVWTLADPAGVTAGPGCDAISATKIRCHRLDPHSRVQFDGNNGDDHLRVNSDQHVSYLAGEEGGDRLIGSRGGDAAIYGNDGDDMLRGRGGKDVFAGGPGDDVIRAVDRIRDRSIDCGDGKDSAFVDRKDPPTKSCEKVVQRG